MMSMGWVYRAAPGSCLVPHTRCLHCAAVVELHGTSVSPCPPQGSSSSLMPSCWLSASCCGTNLKLTPGAPT